jgi:hypothetical protein
MAQCCGESLEPTQELPEEMTSKEHGPGTGKKAREVTIPHLPQLACLHCLAEERTKGIEPQTLSSHCVPLPFPAEV